MVNFYFYLGSNCIGSSELLSPVSPPRLHQLPTYHLSPSPIQTPSSHYDTKAPQLGVMGNYLSSLYTRTGPHLMKTKHSHVTCPQDQRADDDPLWEKKEERDMKGHLHAHVKLGITLQKNYNSIVNMFCPRRSYQD